MRKWNELQAILQDIMGKDGKVYFQQPENLKLTYPCILFDRNDAYIVRADNNPYVVTKRYTITLITKNKDNDKYLDKLLMLPMCSYDRQFISDGLVHEVFNMYF